MSCVAVITGESLRGRVRLSPLSRMTQSHYNRMRPLGRRRLGARSKSILYPLSLAEFKVATLMSANFTADLIVAACSSRAPDVLVLSVKLTIFKSTSRHGASRFSITTLIPQSPLPSRPHSWLPRRRLLTPLECHLCRVAGNTV